MSRPKGPPGRRPRPAWRRSSRRRFLWEPHRPAFRQTASGGRRREEHSPNPQPRRLGLRARARQEPAVRSNEPAAQQRGGGLASTRRWRNDVHPRRDSTQRGDINDAVHWRYREQNDACLCVALAAAIAGMTPARRPPAPGGPRVPASGSGRRASTFGVLTHFTGAYARRRGRAPGRHGRSQRTQQPTAAFSAASCRSPCTRHARRPGGSRGPPTST